MTALIDEERREQFMAEGVHFESEYFLALTYLPPEQREERVKGFLFEGQRQIKSGAQKTLEYFKSRVASFEDLFSSLFQVRRLQGPPFRRRRRFSPTSTIIFCATYTDASTMAGPSDRAPPCRLT